MYSVVQLAITLAVAVSVIAGMALMLSYQMGSQARKNLDELQKHVDKRADEILDHMNGRISGMVDDIRAQYVELSGANTERDLSRGRAQGIEEERSRPRGR